MIGQTISHFKILEKLGEGGMGVVYKAEDTNLKRTVALKFLPRGIQTHQSERDRFLQEAQAAAALNHPNICTIYDIAQDGDEQFIVMEYVDGQTVRQQLGTRNLQLETAISYAIQIGEALQEAHSKGIVHRDIKTDNIMVTAKGQVKVMDFGLAKLKGAMRLTKTSSTIGTAAYMSPEQAQGLDVDHRTDIWSLGVVLFEMLTGKLPFRGEHESAVLYSIVHEEPQALSTFRSDVPLGVLSIIRKTLQKDRSQRYQTLNEMVSELKSAMATSMEPQKQQKSIVVLPFENLSPDPDQEYFSDGLTEEIISDLSAVHSLRVISRSSAMTFKAKKKTISEIAGQLNVQFVLEGSVRKAGNSLRITAQLIDAHNDAHLWAEKYSGTLDDVFDVQEKVSRAIVEALKVKLTRAEEHKMAERPIENVQAYECYLKANVEIFKFTEDSINRAIQYLQHGLEIIGDNPLLFSSIALAYVNLVNIGVEQEDTFAKAEEFADKALRIDDDFPLAHAVFGWIHMYGDLVKSVYHLKRALAVNPDDTLSLALLAFAYMQYFGKISAAVPLCEKLMRIAPLDFPTNASSSALYFYDGQFDRALQAWRKLYEMYPENAYSRFWYALILTYHHENDKASSIIDNAAKENPDNVLTKLGLMLKYVSQKNKEKAYQVMTPDFQKTCTRDASYSHHIAGFFALLNERKEALDWLESAVNHSFFNYPLLAKDPFLDNIRSEERFKKLMERVKREWEEFEV